MFPRIDSQNDCKHVFRSLRRTDAGYLLVSNKSFVDFSDTVISEDVSLRSLVRAWMTVVKWRLLHRCQMGVAREGFRVGPGRPEISSPLVWRRFHLHAAGAEGASPPDWHQSPPPEQRAVLAALSGFDEERSINIPSPASKPGSSHARQRQVYGVAAGAALMVSISCVSRVCEVASATVSARAARWVTPMVVGSFQQVDADDPCCGCRAHSQMSPGCG